MIYNRSKSCFVIRILLKKKWQEKITTMREKKKSFFDRKLFKV